MTQRIEIFLWFFTCLLFQKWCRELNPFFFEYDAKNWTLFSLNVTSRIWFFLNMTQRIEPFSFEAKKRTFISLIWMTPRIVFSNKKYSKNWTFEPCAKKKDSENGTLLKWFFLKWLIELNLFFLNLFKMTQRVEVFFQYDSKNWTLCFSQNVSKNWIFFCKKKIAQRIEPLFHLNYFFTWLNELNFSQFDSKSWVFSNMTRKSWTFFFWIWLKEVSLFEHDSKKWTFLNITQRIEPFFQDDAKNWTFFLNVTQRIDLFSKYEAKNWNLFSKYDAKNWNLFSKYDAKNWNLFSLNMTQRIELFFSDMTQRNEIWKKWLKELTFFSNMTYRIEPLLFSLIWFKELNFVSKRDSKNRNLLCR